MRQCHEECSRQRVFVGNNLKKRHWNQLCYTVSWPSGCLISWCAFKTKKKKKTVQSIFLGLTTTGLTHNHGVCSRSRLWPHSATPNCDCLIIRLRLLWRRVLLLLSRHLLMSKQLFKKRKCATVLGIIEWTLWSAECKIGFNSRLKRWKTSNNCCITSSIIFQYYRGPTNPF